MVANIVNRREQIAIDGLDVSTAVIGLAWGYTDYESQLGIVKTEGRLILNGGGLDWTEDLDDRTNPRWSRGKVVRIQIANESNVLTTPVCGGWLHIIKSQWDGHLTLDIQLGCILTLMDSSTPPGEGFEGFAPGTTQGASNLFSGLSAKIGATIKGGLGGFTLNRPLSKLNNNSAVQQLGQLCWANGRIAYVDGRNGEVQVVPVNIAPEPILDRWVACDAVDYQRRTGVEAPCEKVLVTGTRIEAVPTEDQVNPDPVESFGPASVVNPNVGDSRILLERRIESTTINRGDRTVTHFTQVQQPYGLAVGALPIPDDYRPGDDDRQSKWDAKQAAKALNIVIGSETTEVSRFERITSTGGKVDNRRILNKDTRTLRQAELVYQGYNESRVGSFGEDNYNGSRVSATGLIEADRILVTYTYRSILPGSNLVLRLNRPVLEILTESHQRRAEVFPDARMGNPTAWQFTKRVRRSWYPDPESNGWRLVTETETPALLETTNDITEYSNINAIAQVPKRTTVPEVGPRVQPPRPEAFPVDATTQQTQIVGVSKLPGLTVPAVRDREREYRAEAGMVRSREQAEKVAKIEGAILWGRYNGCEFQCPLFDRWLTASPLQAIDWTEPSGKVMRYLADGLSFAWTARRTIAGADGIWIGQVSQRNYSPPTAPIDPVQPDPESEVEVPPPIRPFRQVHTFQPRLAIAMGFRVRPSSGSTTHTFQPVLAMNALVGFRDPSSGVVVAIAVGAEVIPPPEPTQPGVVVAMAMGAEVVPPPEPTQSGVVVAIAMGAEVIPPPEPTQSGVVVATAEGAEVVPPPEPTQSGVVVAIAMGAETLSSSE